LSFLEIRAERHQKSISVEFSFATVLAFKHHVSASYVIVLLTSVKLPLHNIHLALTNKSKFRCTYFKTTNYYPSNVFIFILLLPEGRAVEAMEPSLTTLSPREVQSVSHFFHDLPFRMLFYFLCLSLTIFKRNLLSV
jgi:hypothetical protein